MCASLMPFGCDALPSQDAKAWEQKMLLGPRGAQELWFCGLFCAVLLGRRQGCSLCWESEA